MMEILDLQEKNKYSKEVKVDVEWYSEPIYKWEISQINDQIYEAVKV